MTAEFVTSAPSLSPAPDSRFGTINIGDFSKEGGGQFGFAGNISSPQRAKMEESFAGSVRLTNLQPLGTDLMSQLLQSLGLGPVKPLSLRIRMFVLPEQAPTALRALLKTSEK